MSSQSERRRAEIAIIDAAYCVEDDPATPPSINLLRLIDAVRKHRDLGLAPLNPRAATSNNSTETSADAAASLGDVRGLALTCFDEICLHGGLTVDQLEVILNQPHQTVSARVNDLMNKAWIADSGIKRKTRSGRNAIVWRPTRQALVMKR